MTNKQALIYVSKNLKALAKEYGDKINKTDNEALQVLKQALEHLKKLEEENQELKNKYKKLKTKYSNIRKYPAINQALMSYDEIDYEILKDEYGEEVINNETS